MLKVIRYFFVLILLGTSVLATIYLWINVASNDYVYIDAQKIPKKRVALVLGTSKFLRNGQKNEFYLNRLIMAKQLFKAGKIDYFVVSGDNHKHNYNEPKQMKSDLVDMGIPAERIQPDYAGFRTLDSVLRMEKVFGHRDYVIISQRFHNQRAVFLARAHGQTPIALDADSPQTQNTTKTHMREVLARVKAVLDILTQKQAKFYGDKIIFPSK